MLVIFVAKAVGNTAVETKQDVVFTKETSVWNGCDVIVFLIKTRYLSTLHQVKMIYFISVLQYLAIPSIDFEIQIWDYVCYHFIL